MKSEKNNRVEHHTTTEELVSQYYAATNPVTQSSIRSIIANRLGLTERHETVQRTKLWTIRERMRKLTYSFESRSTMEEYFKEYQDLD